MKNEVNLKDCLRIDKTNSRCSHLYIVVPIYFPCLLLYEVFALSVLSTLIGSR
jgi:hypothetical protein